jgi:hypothetical protein
VNSLASVHGTLRGRVHFAGDFDKLPDDVAQAFGAVEAAVSRDSALRPYDVTLIW